MKLFRINMSVFDVLSGDFEPAQNEELVSAARMTEYKTTSH